MCYGARVTFAITAALLWAAGAVLEGWAAVVLGWRRAVDLTDEPPESGRPRLVLGGPFRLVRHPQSLGLLLLLAGTAVALRTAAVAVGAALAAALVLVMAVRHDRELRQRWGAAYERYCRAVPLIVPNWR